MIKKTAAFILCALLILSSAAAVFGLDKSIQPISDTGNIDNRGRSIELVYGGENARVYYGSSGISIVSGGEEKHLVTNFAVEKLLVLEDIDSDGYPDFLTYQDAPDYSPQVMTVSGKDGKVLADLHLTRKGYDDGNGLTDRNCFVQQLLNCADGNALIVYDYSVIKVDAALNILWSVTAEDNIWKAVSTGDVNGDGTEDYAYTMQRNTVALISGADGSLVRDWHPCDPFELTPSWTSRSLTTVMNMWDIIFLDGTLWATAENGNVFRIDPVSGDISSASLGILDPEYFRNLLIGYNLEYNMGSPAYRPTRITDWPYMGYRFADTDGKYLLIDCYQGDADTCVEYLDGSWTPAVALFDTETQIVAAIIPVSAGYTATYQKTCLSTYDGTPCIAVVTNCGDKSVTVNYYDYTGVLIYQKEIAAPASSDSNRFELSRAPSGLRIEFFRAGCIETSEDLKTVDHAYDTVGTTLKTAPDGSFFVTYSTNGHADRIEKYVGSLKTPEWTYELKAEYTNKGFEYIRFDRDYDQDGNNDVMAIVNSYKEDGETEASWYFILSGSDGSELFNARIKTGTTTIDKKKVDVFLISDKVDMVRDLDNDKKPELLCGETIISSRRLTVLGYLYAGVNAEGRSFNVGDTNGDGLPDFLVVSDKETRLYESRLGMSYGYASVEYRKTNTQIANNKDLDPMTTSELIGDIDADGISEIVLIAKNDQGFQTFRVYNGKTLEVLYDLCPDGITGDSESFVSLGYDINGDGWNELYARNGYWEYCIHDGKTGGMLINLTNVGREEEDYGVITGPVITYGYDTKPGMGEYHPDYLVPFYPLQDKPSFIITSDVDGDGLGDIAQIVGYWDREVYSFLQKLVITGTKNFTTVAEVKLSAIPDYMDGTLLKVEGSDRYAALISPSKLDLLDLSGQRLVAAYKVQASNALQIDKDIIITTPQGELLKLNIDNSFTLNQAVPEETADHVLNISWDPAQDFSIMTIYDNGTAVYSGSDTSASIRLMQGEHELSLSMDDGQGKVYKELHHVNVSEQKSFPVLPTVLTGVLLIACLFFGILRKARIAGVFRKEAAK